MKKLILSFLTMALFATFSFGQLAAPQTLTNGSGHQITFDVDQTAANKSDLYIQNTSSGNRTQVRILPGAGNNVAFVNVFNSSDRTKSGFVNFGARQEFGVFSLFNLNDPAVKLKHIVMELDGINDFGDEAFMVTTGGFNGTASTPTVLCKIDNSGVSTIEAKVQATVAAPDYVFKADYNLRSLDEVEAYINENSHLPEIPSAAEFAENGIVLGKMSFDLLKKVEELTLYMIEMKKENEALKARISTLEKK